MSGDQIDAQGSQGLVNNPQGTVEQQFGDRTDINAGGDVALRDIDKRNIRNIYVINTITGISGTQLLIDIIANELSRKANNDCGETTNAKSLKSYLMVAIKELQPKPNLKFDVNAWLIPDDSVEGTDRFRWLDINVDINEGIKIGLWSPIKITELVKDLLKQCIDLLFGKDYELTIEFFLPIDYLSTELDRLDVIPDSIDCDEFSPIGKEYRVLVRSCERLHDRYKRYHVQWKSNWEKVDKNLKKIPSIDTFEPFTTVNGCSWKKLTEDLKARLGIKILCMPPESERRNLFKAILNSAVPIAIWLRKDFQECDRELNRLLTSDHLETLPDYIRKERINAYICDAPEEHLGNHLVLLWEDPNRLPPEAKLLPTGQ